MPVDIVLLIHILEHGYIHLTVTDDDFDRILLLRVGNFDGGVLAKASGRGRPGGREMEWLVANSPRSLSRTLNIYFCGRTLMSPLWRGNILCPAVLMLAGEHGSFVIAFVTATWISVSGLHTGVRRWYCPEPGGGGWWVGGGVVCAMGWVCLFAVDTACVHVVWCWRVCCE
ncbi:hypothetical protein KC19_10G154300 [Ceratodon purpureus]|uniref:Uncharacterized protein n=1 Tax=Ceratodon purpureus TaxID=3225 RepID=A0A8T0GPA3_CERPU|nr:hypothetical protein KC19_10G153900 [Ceratodon purpureus]KAG0560096.1 hypothetical protein KC19_10G154000 [Ceratodon purpureus]KAG0560099.1 hypothetical protein KC19_10G154300 [Ceratodon purpureus]